jgi:hypothetical protein
MDQEEDQVDAAVSPDDLEGDDDASATSSISSGDNDSFSRRPAIMVLLTDNLVVHFKAEWRSSTVNHRTGCITGKS